MILEINTSFFESRKYTEALPSSNTNNSKCKTTDYHDIIINSTLYLNLWPINMTPPRLHTISIMNDNSVQSTPLS